MTTAVEGVDINTQSDHATNTDAHVFTLEQAFYAVSLLLAAGIRMWNLARTPLSTVEATNSLAAWWSAMAVDQPLALVATSPLFYQMQRILFWIGADGDGAARIVSVAAGACLVLTPWLFRRVIGRPAAIILSLLLAFDPWLVFFSRLADGAVLTALLTMALLGTGISLILADGRDEQKRKSASYLLVILVGLYVTSGHMAWSFLPVLAVFALLNYRALKSAIVLNYTAALLLIGAFLIGSTAFLSDPGGITLVSASLTQWVNSVFSTGTPTLNAQQAAGYAWSWPLSRLLADQPFVLLFGVIGLVHMAWRRNRAPFAGINWPALMWIWLAWGLFLCAMPGRSPYSLLVIVFPLLFGSAYLAAALINAVPVGENARETLGTIAILIVLMVSIVFWFTALAASPGLDTFMLQAVLLLLLLAAALLVFYGIYVNWRSAAWIGLVVLGMALLIVNVGSTWRVNHRVDLGRYGGLINESADLDVRQLVANVEKFSAQKLGDAHEITVLIDQAGGGKSGRLTTEQQAILAWNLRNMRNLSWRMRQPEPEVVFDNEPPVEAELQDNPEPMLIITAKLDEDVDAPALVNEHVGSTYQLRSFEPVIANAGGEVWPDDASSELGARADRYWATRLHPWLRWLMYREPVAPRYTEEVVLWIPWEE